MHPRNFDYFEHGGQVGGAFRGHERKAAMTSSTNSMTGIKRAGSDNRYQRPSARGATICNRLAMANRFAALAQGQCSAGFPPGVGELHFPCVVAPETETEFGAMVSHATCAIVVKITVSSEENSSVFLERR